MDFPLSLSLWTLLGLLLLGHGSLGCLEEERIALLKLKASINYPSPNGSALPSWGGEVSHCCSWEGLECDSTTKRVIQLSLFAARRYDEVGAWSLNATLFEPLEELKILELCFNHIEGMDLSYNNSTGPIPPEIGYLSGIHTLNLSYNHITGSIPETFSNLKEVESLDLSHNSLSGQIPSQLTELYRLSVFTVAYNNLSGRTPERKAQFATFEQVSYEGNSLLCGPPLEKNCSITEAPGTPPPSDTTENDSMRDTFVWSFAGTFVVAFLGVIAFLHFNPYYGNLIFNFIKEHIPSFH